MFCDCMGCLEHAVPAAFSCQEPTRSLPVRLDLERGRRRRAKPLSCALHQHEASKCRAATWHCRTEASCSFAELKAAKSSAWPAEKTVYDWCYSHENGGWVDWMSTVAPFVPDPDASFSQIIVPTSDTVRYNYLLRILAAAGKHVLYVGETGTGAHLMMLLFQVPMTRCARLMSSCYCVVQQHGSQQLQHSGGQ